MISRWVRCAAVALCAVAASACVGGADVGTLGAGGTSVASGNPANTTSGTPSASSTGDSGSGPSGSGPSGGDQSAIGPSGGKLDVLSFAIVGDTRPPVDGDTAGYPTKIITQIYADLAQRSPMPAFAVATGDYMFAKPYIGANSVDQLNIYLKAHAGFGNQLFPALGNHECTGKVDSNCGAGNPDGTPYNYTNYLSMMLKGISATPYYAVEIDDTNGKWTSKFVFIAANAWDSTQATWLDKTLSKPTTYTFVVRHESTIANQAPGVTPSDAIVAKHPYTVMLCGHTHTYEWKSLERQLVVGNGGAPLTNTVNYGYVIALQRADGAIEFKEYDYDTIAMQHSFALRADGSKAQ